MNEESKEITLEQTMEAVTDFLIHNQTLGREKIEMLIVSVDRIKKDVDLMKDDQPPVGGTIENEMKCFDFLTSLFLEELSPKLLSFIKGYALLVFNWNNNIDKDKTLAIRASLLMKWSDGIFTMNETISLLKTLIKNAREIAIWKPPAFEASEQYLKELDKQIEEENKKKE